MRGLTDASRLRRAACLAAVLVLLPLMPAAEAGDRPCALQPTGGLQRRTIDSVWSYELYVPSVLASRPAGRDVPLVVAFHGAGQTGAGSGQTQPWIDFSEVEGFVLAFPNSPIRSWPSSYHRLISDRFVDFARRVVADVQHGQCIDDDRIFATGYSHGAFFSQRLACDASDLFASFTEYAGGAPGSCTLTRPVPLAMFHGDQDATVTPEQGRSSRDAWAGRLHCDPPTRQDLADGFELVYAGCDEGTELRWREYAGQGHSFPSGPRERDILDRMWDFHMRFPMPRT